jgi:predicted AAA+ superfamily ATPase
MPAGACPGCSKQTAPISLELLHGLLRVARDRLLEEGSATFDVLYLAARGEGYCSLTCWRVNAATDDQLSLLERRKK